MSSVDERIVEMRFDNQQFESGVKTSLGTLDRLKNSLNGLDGSADSLSHFQTELSDFNTYGLANSLSIITDRFSVFGIMADQVIRRVTNGLFGLGLKAVNVVKNLTFDPIFSGFAAYEEESKAIQVLMNATGESMESVEGYADKLRWYTNETSYNYQDMLKYASQFSSNGVKMEDAIGAMMGIANAAGVAGSTTEQASHAMQGFSIAVGQGKMDSRSWTWIKTARMDTEQFKNELIDAGVAAGTLIQETDKQGNVLGTYVAKAGKANKALGEVTAANFESLLSQGWVTKDVLTGKEFSVLTKYAKATEQIYSEYLNSDGELTADIIRRMGDELDGFSLKAFKAANQTRTLSDALEYIRVAGATAWGKTFKTIFGNFEESSELWGNVTEQLYTLFLEDLDNQNDVLDKWKELGGHTNIVNSIYNALDGLIGIVGKVKDAFHDIFPKATAESLKSISSSVEKLTESFKNFSAVDEDGELINQNFKNLVDTFQGFLSLISISGKALKSFFKALEPVTNKLKEFGTKILEVFGKVGRYLTDLNNLVDETDFFSHALDKLSGKLKSIKEKFANFSDTLRDIYTKVKDFLGEKFSRIAEGIKRIIKDPSWESFAKVGMTLGALFTGVNLFRLGDHIKWFWDCLTGFPAQVIDFLGTLEDTIWDYGKNQTADILKKVAISVAILAASLLLLSAIDSDKLAISVGAIAGLFASLLGSVTFLSIFFGKGGVFAALSGKNIATLMVITTALLKIAASVVILAAALKIIDSINPDNLEEDVFQLIVIMGALVAALAIFSNYASTSFNMKSVGKAFKSMGTALLLMAVSLAIMDKFVTNPDTIFNAIVLIGAMAGVLTLMSNFAVGGKRLIAAGASLIAISTALLIMSGALAVMEKLGVSTDTVMNAIIIMGGMATILTLMANFAVNAPAMLAAGVALIAASAALLIMSGALAIIGKFANDTSVIANAIFIFGGIALIMGIIGGLGAAVGVGMIAGATGLLIASAALLVLAGALTIMATVPINSIHGILLGLMAFIGIFAMIGDLAGVGMIAAGAGLLLMAAAIAILAPAILALGAASSSAVDGILILAGVFLLLGAAGLLLTPLMPAILAFSGTLFVASIALAAAGAAGLVFSAALLSLSASVPAFVAGILSGLYLLIVGIEEFIASLLDMAATIVRIVPFLGTILGNDFNTLANDFRNNVDRMNLDEIISSATEDIPTAVEDVAPESGEAAAVVGEAITSELEESTSTLGEVGSEAAEEYIEGFTGTLSEMETAIPETVVDKTMATMAEKSDEFGEIGKADASSFLFMFSQAASDGSAQESGAGLSDASLTGLMESISGFGGTGDNAASAFIDSIIARYGDAENAAAGLGNAATSGLNSSLDVHSPSRVFMKIGKFAGEGFIMGMQRMFSLVSNASSDMGNVAFDSMHKALIDVSNSIENDPDFKPVITPVVDLSNVRNAANGINRYIGGHVPLNVNGTVRAGSKMEDDIEEFINLGNKILKTIQNGSTLYFDDGAFAGRINRRLGSRV